MAQKHGAEKLYLQMNFLLSVGWSVGYGRSLVLANMPLPVRFPLCTILHGGIDKCWFMLLFKTESTLLNMVLQFMYHICSKWYLSVFIWASKNHWKMVLFLGGLSANDAYLLLKPFTEVRVLYSSWLTFGYICLFLDQVEASLGAQKST
jgi:hypothetical protein